MKITDPNQAPSAADVQKMLETHKPLIFPLTETVSLKSSELPQDFVDSAFISQGETVVGKIQREFQFKSGTPYLTDVNSPLYGLQPKQRFDMYNLEPNVNTYTKQNQLCDWVIEDEIPTAMPKPGNPFEEWVVELFMVRPAFVFRLV